MATATRKTAPLPASAPERSPAPRSLLDRVLGVFDAIYRFLASLKLAVITLGTLAAVLAYATWFESWYGGQAVQEWVYKSPGFALLLAFLGANVLCAALIRYPWKKRQTGFVITHSGLLVLLVGSWWSARTADEGQFGMLEGQTMSELFRRDDSAIRLRKLDPHTEEVDSEFGEYELPFHPGTFAWGPGQPRWLSPSGWFAHLTALKPLPGPDHEEVLNRPRDLFQVVVKAFLPASVASVVHEADPAGDPMVQIRPRIKGPGMPRMQDVFPGGRWIFADRRFGRAAVDRFPARFVFAYVEQGDAVEDFLNPPEAKGYEGAVRFRYRDRSGKERTYDWALDGQSGQKITLPESTLAVELEKVAALPTDELPVTSGGKVQSLARVLGDPVIPIAQFRVRDEDGPSVEYYAWGSLPNLPNLMPSRDAKKSTPEQLVRINYFVPPVLAARGGGGGGLMGQVEVLGTPEGKLYYRVFRRGKDQAPSTLGPHGPLKPEEEVTAFGGDANMPMTMVLAVEQFFPRGREREVCEPVVLPAGKKDEGLAACLVALTVDGETKEVWVQHTQTLEKAWQRVPFKDGLYEIAFDADRKPLGFQLTLEDFDRGFDPGTEKPSRFASTVLLTDKGQGVEDRQTTISMNAPLTHRGYTFYQSSYRPHFDPKTGRKTGRFISILQVATDPGLPIKYLGCALVVLGAFVQFYMRAGIFTDGGKKERARLAAREAKRAGTNGQPGNDVTDVNESEETL